MSDESSFTKRGFLSLLLGAGSLLVGLDEAEARRRRPRRHRRRHKAHAHSHGHPSHSHPSHAHHQAETRHSVASQQSQARSASAPIDDDDPEPVHASPMRDSPSPSPSFNTVHSGGGGGGGGGGWSDRRLKRDIVHLGVSPSGLPIYSFQYVWGGPRYVGVMAQDLLKLRPDAVVFDECGFYRVDYSKIDVAMCEEALAA